MCDPCVTPSNKETGPFNQTPAANYDKFTGMFATADLQLAQREQDGEGEREIGE